jgi:nanoRNase/pAp phosphatase (c-di-AMP/oligoRNAs hydrolase)
MSLLDETTGGQVAYRLGGGGHKQASGTMLPGPLNAAAARLLTEVKKELGIK